MFDPTELLEVTRTAAGVPVRAISDDDLLTGVEALEGARRALDAAQVAFVAELDARDLTDRTHGHRTKDWLAHTHGLDPAEARKRCTAGRRLRQLDRFADALADGRITLDHVRVVTNAMNARVVDVVLAAQDEFIRLAATMGFDAWSRHVRALIALADQDGGHDPRIDKRSVTLGRGLDGELFLRGTLLGAGAATIEHVLETHTDRLFRRARKDWDTTSGELALPSRAQLRADALEELLRAGAPALGGGTATAPAADVTLVIPHDHPALTKQHTNSPVCCGTDVELSGSALDLLLCDPLFAAVVTDSLGTPLDAGHTIRHANRQQRRALAVRDGGCAFPGCCAPPRWCDAHHIQPWDHDGPTDIANLALLCRYHHGVIHRRGWTMRALPHQRFEITTARGQTLEAQRRCRPPGP